MTPESADPARRQGTPRWVRRLALGYLLIQVGIPLAQLARPRPERFGWQMYSAVRPVDVVVIDFEGKRHSIVATLLDFVRADLDPLIAITPELCANPVVAEVVTIDQKTGVERSRKCSRPARPGRRR